MSTQPIPTQKPSPQDQLLQEKLIEDIAAQSYLMDALARQLITLELALPGIYATALKLVAGDDSTIAGGTWLYLTFACWALALVLALLSLLPRSHAVDTGRVYGEERDGTLSIEGYFRRSALHKRRLLIWSSGLFFGGVCAAALTVL